MNISPGPVVRGVKETALYVDDLSHARSFYRDVMGLRVRVEDGRFCALDVNGAHVLLLFLRGASTEETQLPGGVIPPHDGSGPVHVGFSIDTTELAAWEAHFARHGVKILSRMKWPRGGESVYFHDPDRHVLELLTPGVWETY